MLAADYPFLEVLASMFFFFLFIIWIWILITVFSDIFRRRDIGGGSKTLWIIFVIVLPYLGVFVYLIANHDGMAERNIQQMQKHTATDGRVHPVRRRKRWRCRARSRRPRASSTRARSRRPSSTRSSRRRWRRANEPSLWRGARQRLSTRHPRHREGALGSSDVRSRRRSTACRRRPAATEDPPYRGVDRRHDPRPRRPAARGDRRLGLVRGPVGHAHRDLDRLHRPGLSLPGTPDGAHGARVVRDPSLRVSGRRHVHAGAGGLRDGRRAQQLRAREHGHVRDAPHVRRDRQGSDVPGCPRRIRRAEDLLLRHRHADLRLPLLAGGRVVRLPVRQRAGRDLEPPRVDARDHRRSDLPPCSPASCSSGPGSRRCGRRRYRAPPSSATSARS